MLGTRGAVADDAAPPGVSLAVSDAVSKGKQLPDAEPGRQGWFGPSVRGIGGASFLSDLGHEVPTSLLPRFLTSTLGAPAAALGLIEGLADGLAGVAQLAGGALAD